MFDKARIKLTVWYTLFIMLISLSFSGMVYQILQREVDRFSRGQQFRIERQFPMLQPLLIFEANPELVAEAKTRIVVALAMVNTGILVLAAMSGYFLAGKTLQPIKEMVDDQNRFVGDASHELRTPLTALKSAIEVFLRDKKATVADSRQLALESLEEIDKLQSLSDAMLKLAQFKKPHRKPEFAEVDVGEIVKRAVSRVGPAAKLREVKIKTEVDAEVVWGNAEQLPDMLVILLDNAIKYSRKGEEVSITATKNDHNVTISVSDQGIGIDKKDLPHIFERFYRADKARSKQDAGGYGLGLSIAQQIAVDHRGKIEIKSKPGKGSVFSVTLPTTDGKNNFFS